MRISCLDGEPIDTEPATHRASLGASGKGAFEEFGGWFLYDYGCRTLRTSNAVVCLEASAMSEPVYRRMGFETKFHSVTLAPRAETVAGALK